MNWFEAIILGLVQGLTEFLPVSSSGHLELGKHLFGIDAESNFYFTIAVVPAISQSGATIAAGLMLGNRKEEIARFSFLMVLVSIVGANLLEIVTKDYQTTGSGAGVIMLGFISAFIAGYFACKWMVELVKRSKMTWFAIYCTAAGILSILLG
jgi:undecaprenyl-diphosphatase